MDRRGSEAASEAVARVRGGPEPVEEAVEPAASGGLRGRGGAWWRGPWRRRGQEPLGGGGSLRGSERER